MVIHPTLPLALVLLLAIVVPSPAAVLDPPPTGARTDEEAEAALVVFRREFATRDAKAQCAAVLRLATVDHPRVGKALLSLTGYPGPEVAATAVRALVRVKTVRTRLLGRLDDWLNVRKTRPEVIAAALTAIGELNLRDQEDRVIRCIDTPSDEVAIAGLEVLGRWRSVKALPWIIRLWEVYPTETRWDTSRGFKGGSRKDAMKKWARHYGDLKPGPRPELVRAIRRNVNRIAAVAKPKEPLRTIEDLQGWMRKNRELIRRLR